MRGPVRHVRCAPWGLVGRPDTGGYKPFEHKEPWSVKRGKIHALSKVRSAGRSEILSHAPLPAPLVGARAPSEARSHARHDGVLCILQLADYVRHHGCEQPQLRLRCTNVLSLVLSSSFRAHDGRGHLGPIFLCGMASSSRGTTAAAAEASVAAANFTCASASS